METSTLRWIIIIVGILILGSIFLFGNPEKKRKPRASRKKEGGPAERREPTLDDSPPAEPEGDDKDAAEQSERGFREPDQGDLLEQSDPPERPKEPRRPRKPAGPPPEKIQSLFLLARDNHLINGAELLQAAIKTGMQFGDMDIFHRLPEGSERPIFSMANAAKPGHFDRDAWNTFETSGVVLFMTLPGPVSGLDAWDSLLATARRMAEILHADVLDDEQNPFTRQKEAQVREQMRDYDRRRS